MLTFIENYILKVPRQEEKSPILDSSSLMKYGLQQIFVLLISCQTDNGTRNKCYEIGRTLECPWFPFRIYWIWESKPPEMVQGAKGLS